MKKPLEIRARRIFARLTQEKKILIILDDVWERLELGLIGIPYRVDHKWVQSRTNDEKIRCVHSDGYYMSCQGWCPLGR